MTLNLQLAITILNSTMFLTRNSINDVSVLQLGLSLLTAILSIVSYVSFVLVLACQFYSNYTVMSLGQVQEIYTVSFNSFVAYSVSISLSLVMNLGYASIYDIDLMPITSRVSDHLIFFMFSSYQPSLYLAVFWIQYS